METLSVGCKAYYDSFAGLVPCKVTAILGDTRTLSHKRVRAILTGSKGSYSKGKTVEASSMFIVPRRAVYWSGCKHRIGPYKVAEVSA